MAKSNKDRISEALDYFVSAYRPFILEKLKSRYPDSEPEDKALEILEQNSRASDHVPENAEEWDMTNIFSVIINEWQYHFRNFLETTDRSMLHELKEVRNGWAHNKAFSLEDTTRALDTTRRLLLSIGAQKEAGAVDQLVQETMRIRDAEMERVQVRRARKLPTEGTPDTHLRPWREVIIPHRDVREGAFSKAQFAADLSQVYRGDAMAEYGDPKEFFRRTYLTEGLSTLITNALKRFHGQGGDPVIELQTNFGGGKTHSMLALYHLCAGLPLAELSGVDQLAREMDFENLPNVRRAVLVGTALTPGMLDVMDGITPNTLWGLMALQLGGKYAYEMIRKADETSMSPGSDILVRLFKAIGAPCLILIDEWVAYCRQLWNQSNNPAGSFDTNLSFAQSLTEASKSCPEVLIVASLPQSKVEVGGEGGSQALASLEDTFGRIESSWRPANQVESYEIVRRRLFEPIESSEAFANRDVTISAYRKFYKDNATEFPPKVHEVGYVKKLEDSYPIHPEMFDRLYNDWSTLEHFQRTRGVLRLMATVIHNLWTRGDSSVMIMPGIVPLDDGGVQEEFTRYLSSPWKVLLDKEVDGPSSLAMQIDKSSSRFGQIWAARRAARAVFIGSAATETTSTKGLEIRSIRLACAQPGENISIFGDALRQLSEQANHIYHDGAQYWLSTQPNVSNTAKDRAAQMDEEKIVLEIQRLLKRNVQRDRGGYAAAHVCPESSADILDEPSLRLVVLGPKQGHVNNNEESEALSSAEHFLQKRGNSPRLNQNSLVFIAPDKGKLEDLHTMIGLSLAWNSITRDSLALDLSPYNLSMAQQKVEEMTNSANIRLLECYRWILMPFQRNGTSATQWKTVTVQAGDLLAARSFQRLRRDGDISDQLGALSLRKALDACLWRGENHVTITQVQEDFARYLYLEKVSSPELIIDALRDALSQWDEGMALAYADEFKDGKYHGLAMNKTGVAISPQGYIVKYVVARKQMDEAAPATNPSNTNNSVLDGNGTTHIPHSGVSERTNNGGGTVEPAGLPTRYFGEFKVSPDNPLLFSEVMKEVLTHLSKDPNTKVTISVNVDAEDDKGFSESTQRIVRENAKTLGFANSDFSD